MRDFLDFIIPIFFSAFIIFLFFCPIFYRVSERIEALEKLHDQYICLECNSLVQK